MNEFPQHAENLPTEAEVHELEMLSQLEQLKAQLDYVRADRQRAREQLADANDFIEDLGKLAKAASRSVGTARAMAAETLIFKVLALTEPEKVCSFCDGARRVSPTPLSDETCCPECA